MADDMQRLIVSLEARTAAFEKAMNRANGVANQRARAIESRFAKMNSSIGNSLAGVGKRWIAGLAAGLAAGELVKLSDSATKIDNALKVAGLSGAELEKVYGKLRDSAVKNAAPLEALVELYSRASLSAKELGINQAELDNFTDKVALALRVNGKSAQETSGALLQLSQALGSGTVRAEEFSSIQEGALPILQAVAAGLKEAGGSVSALRQLVVDGKLSSEAFFRAFEAGAVTLEQKVSGSTLTVDQALGNLKTALIDSVREFNNATGAGGQFADGINNLAGAISDFDISGFVQKIREARDELQALLTDAANSGVIEQLAEKLTGAEITLGKPIKLETIEAQQEAAALEREIVLLQATIEKNSELGFDNTDALARIGEVRAALASIQGAIASDPAVSGVTPPYVPGTPGDPNAVAGQYATSLANKPPAVAVQTVSIKDFKAPTGSKGGGGGSGKKSKQDDYAREIEQIKERTAAIQAETAAMAGINPLIDDYGYAIDKARAVHDLLTAAQKAGIAITPELRANIDALAEGYATASVEAQKLADSQDRARAAAQDMSDLGKDVLGGFIRDLRDGKSGAEALSNALGKVADKLLDVALNSLFDSKGGGGLGGLFSFIPKLFGFADGGIAAHGKPMRKFAKGGVSNTAAIFGEAGPEAAVPLPDGRSIPVTLSTPNVPQARPGG